MNLIKAEKEFEKYVKKYDAYNPKILRKINHSYRVVNVSKEIANSLLLTQEDIMLAKLIGLLHDIGRFEQIRIYNTFSDKDSIDHADFGVELLFKNNFIRNFIEEDKYDNIIYKAIKNHNKYKIENGLSEKELLHCKIIRDADKTDIYKVYIKDIEENRNELFNYDQISSEVLNEKVINSIRKNELVNRFDAKNEADKFATALAFVFDYNFSKGLEIVKEKNYLYKLISRVKTKENYDIWDNIYNIVNTYITKRV